MRLTIYTMYILKNYKTLKNDLKDKSYTIFRNLKS